MLLDTLPEGGLLAIHWTFCSAALVFVIARTCVRLKTSGHLMLDDYIMYAAWAVLLANTILQTLQNHSTYIMSKGFQGLLPLGAKFMAAGNIYVRYEFVSIGLFWTVTWLVKASFLAFYWRLLNGLVLYQKMWYAICVFSFLAYLGCWISSVLNCDPVSDYWDFGKCTSAADERRGTISIAYSTAVDILTDILIMVLPLVLVYKVRISRQQKFGLCAVFMLALVTITIAIVRCVQAIRNQRELIFLALWGTIESATAVIVGCLLPFYSVLARRPTGRSFGSSNNRYHGFPDENTGSIPLRSAVSKVSFSTKIHSSSRSRPADRTPTESLTEILDTDDYDLSSTKTIHVRQDYYVTEHPAV